MFYTEIELLLTPVIAPIRLMCDALVSFIFFKTNMLCVNFEQIHALYVSWLSYPKPIRKANFEVCRMRIMLKSVTKSGIMWISIYAATDCTVGSEIVITKNEMYQEKIVT